MIWLFFKPTDADANRLSLETGIEWRRWYGLTSQVPLVGPKIFSGTCIIDLMKENVFEIPDCGGARHLAQYLRPLRPAQRLLPASDVN
jgi:hypothetical protein